MRRIVLFASLAALAACGFNGTDPDEDEQQAAATPQAAPSSTDPDLAELATQDIPDSEPRPQMQLQVVLDQRGFGPGVIDGKEGLSTANALKGFQEASSLPVTGKLDEATKAALAQWNEVPATRVVRIPASWVEIEYQPVPDEPEDQAQMEQLGYESLGMTLVGRAGNGIKRNFKLLEVGLPLWPLSWRHRF